MPRKRSEAQKKAIAKATASRTSETHFKQAVTLSLNQTIRNQATTPLLKDYARQILLGPCDGEGTPYYKKYLEAFFKEALENPDGRCGQTLASGFLNEQLFQKLDAGIGTGKVIDTEYERYKILKTLYKEQKEIYEDPNRYLFAICSRRVGKSTLASRLLVADALNPNHRGLYVGVRFDQAINIGMKMVLDLLEEIGYTKIQGVQQFSPNSPTIEYKASKAEGLIEFGNGSTITFKGNSKAGEADKYQGFKYTLCVVDEVQSQPCLEYLLNSILGAAMVDVKNSKQLLIGTPPRIPNTYCEKLWNMKDNVYSKFHWDMSRNPYLENDVETEIEIACKKAGVTKDSAFIQREYYGKFVYDTEALIFKDYKTYKGDLPKDFLPTKVWIGVDWGFVDHNAIVTTAVDYYSKKAYVIEQQDFARADSDEQERAVQKAYFNAIAFLRKYNVRDPDHFTTIVTDTNQPSLTLKLQRLGLPVVNAYKPEVTPTMDQLAAEMRTGRLMIPETGILKEECDRTVWERDDIGNILPKVDDLTFHPNAIHALRYCNIMWLDDWKNYESATMTEVPAINGPNDDYFNENNEGKYETITVEEEW